MDIDFVVLWVDGNDPDWLKEKSKYDPEIVAFDGGKQRYRDWNLMRYWFRAVETFAPWVHKVYFVTWGHVPSFLNIHAPKLCIVKHEDFIPEQYLPTFNSCSIEVNLHRIPGLSEHFVYFNDDMFLLRPCAPEDFFRDGLPCLYSIEKPLMFSNTYITPPHHFFNDLGAINRNFNKRDQVRKNRFKYISKKYNWKDNVRTLLLERLYPDSFLGFAFSHGPSPYLKSTFSEVWKAETECLDISCKEKFRTNRQVNQCIMQWWQIAKGAVSPSRTDNLYIFIFNDTIDRICKEITSQGHRFICLQDSDVFTGDTEELSAKMIQAFDAILPDKSQFEL